MLLATPSLIARPHMRPASVSRIPWYCPLFAHGEVGLVFDFTDLSKLFQDTAGTTPVTAVGQTISAVRDALSGFVRAVLTAGTATLQFDATKGLYYCAMGTTANFKATGAVPSSLGGNATITLISALQLTKPTSATYMPCYIGPSSPSNGNAISLQQSFDTGLSQQCVEILQYGAGRGRIGPQQTGTGVFIGRKNSGVGSGTALDIWWQGTQVDNNTAVPNANPMGAITTLDYYIGKAGGIAMNIYNSVCISRPITTTEIASISVTALT